VAEDAHSLIQRQFITKKWPQHRNNIPAQHHGSTPSERCAPQILPIVLRLANLSSSIVIWHSRVWHSRPRLCFVPGGGKRMSSFPRPQPRAAVPHVIARVTKIHSGARDSCRLFLKQPRSSCNTFAGRSLNRC
jgi:hypothetical protein